MVRRKGVVRIARKFYTIEEAARRLHVTPRTLHYYEEIGLLDDISRTEGGHRQYDEPAIKRVEHILKLKDLLGISLQEIRAILEAERHLEELKTSYYQEHSDDQRERFLQAAAELLAKQIDQIDKKIEKLQIMRQGFEQRLSKTHDLLNRFSPQNDHGEGVTDQ